jgi:hypothetical protein
LSTLAYEVDVKLSGVEFADAVVYPRTVVVVGCHALVAVLAMFRPQRHFNVTDRAELALDKEHNVVVVFILLINFFLNCFHFRRHIC